MKPGGGKAKGAAFERRICKELSQWLTNGLRDDLLWRSAMSGGRATVARKKGGKNKTQSGDISAIDPRGHALTDLFAIECKNYRNLDLTSAMLKGLGKFITFWEQAEKDAVACDKYPMLIAHQNLMPILVAMPQLAARTLFKIQPIASLRIEGKWVSIFLWDEFMKAKCPL